MVVLERRDLVRRHVELGEEVGALEVEGGGEERDSELLRERLQLLVLGPLELERLAVLAVGGAVAVLVLVRLRVGLAGVETAVVALLQLDRVRARLLRRLEQLLRLLDRALVVMAHLGDHIAVGRVADLGAVDDEHAVPVA